MKRETNSLYDEVPIDETGTIGYFDVIRQEKSGSIVGINLESDEQASYRVDLGFDTTNGIEYFDLEAEETYVDTQSVSDAWMQSEKYLRINVTSPASSGATAKLYVSSGTA